jgi:hypothetical protein
MNNLEFGCVLARVAAVNNDTSISSPFSAFVLIYGSRTSSQSLLTVKLLKKFFSTEETKLGRCREE